MAICARVSTSNYRAKDFPRTIHQGAKTGPIRLKPTEEKPESGT